MGMTQGIHTKWLVVTLLALFFAAALFTAAAAPVQAAESLLVGSDVAYPPFEFIDENGYMTGFDMALIRAVAEAMGREAVIINTAWDGIIPGLVNGDYDVLISAMTITEERALAVDFSDPYFETGQVIVVPADNTTIQGPEDLVGKRVTVQIGTTGQFAAEDIDGIGPIDKYNTMPAAFLALKNGQADASVADELTALQEVARNPDDLKVVGGILTVEQYGIAVKKGNRELLAAINEALANVRADGTYDRLLDRLYDEWIPQLVAE